MEKIGAELVDARAMSGMDDIRTMRFEQRLQTMTQQELVTALDKIPSLDLPVESRKLMERKLLGQLIEKDPELVLMKYSDRFQHSDGLITVRLSLTIFEVIKPDPAKAIEWPNQQITAGKFDSKSLDGINKMRFEFEGIVMSSLIHSDLAAGYYMNFKET